MSKLYIPDTVRVGFQKYPQLPSGHLSFITYFNARGTLAKERAWNSWCDATVPYLDIPNTPSLFSLRKDFNVLDYCNRRNKDLIVSDTRNLDFYMEPNNLILLLANTQIAQKEIQDPCVFAWFKRNLILLPTTSPLYI